MRISKNIVDILSCVSDNDWISTLNSIVSSLLNDKIGNGLTHLRCNLVVYDLNDDNQMSRSICI